VRVYLGYVLIVLFVIFTGLSASVVRAGIMGVIGLMAIQQGRQYLALLSLVLSAAVMVLINPKVLMADSGFQLSIMATLGIVVFGERIKNRFEKFGTMIADTISMTLSAQIFNLPIMMLSFGRVATVSLFANLLVLPLLPIAMLFGFVAVVVSFINLGLGRIVGFVAYIVLECVLKIVDVMAELSFLNLEKTVTGEIMVVYYLCFWGYLLFWIRARREKFARSYL